MTDMLVRLYDLPDPAKEPPAQAAIRRPLVSDARHVLAFIEQHFGATAPGWVDECRCALGGRPPTCFVAVEGGELLGFACFDATARGLFGPVGVAPVARGRGLGRALLLACLRQMAADGYAYAVIGWVHSEAYYRRAVGAESISGSEPGLYASRLRG